VSAEDIQQALQVVGDYAPASLESLTMVTSGQGGMAPFKGLTTHDTVYPAIVELKSWLMRNRKNGS